jgi:hypothetical protein
MNEINAIHAGRCDQSAWTKNRWKGAIYFIARNPYSSGDMNAELA